jgi:transcriptional regulator with XRE-family HTH domain
MITGRQIAAALALLGWSKNELVRRAGVSIATVGRAINSTDNLIAANLARIERALVEGGVIFLDADSDGGVGVRLRG